MEIGVGYYPSGKLSARSSFKDGDQISGDFFNEDGTRNESVNEFSRANSYPGGSRALQRFLIRNLNYPGTAVNRSIEGTVLQLVLIFQRQEKLKILNFLKVC